MTTDLPRRTRRLSSSGTSPRRYPALDGLRALGALAVLTTHVGFTSGASLTGSYAGLLARLDMGVALFFVISGFLLFRPHARAAMGGTPPPSIGRYVRHRIVRIFPVLWIAVLGAMVLLPPLTAGQYADDYLRTAVLIQIYTGYEYLPGLSQMWSLATEVAFYVLLPFVAWALRYKRIQPERWLRRSLVTMSIAPLLSAAWVTSLTAGGADERLQWLPSYLGWFAAGMALATWVCGRQSGLVARSWLDTLAGAPLILWSCALSLYLVASTPLAGPYGLEPAVAGEALVKQVMYLAIATLLVLPCVMPSGPDNTPVAALSSRPARWFGDISYGIFAYHLVILGLIERALDHEPFGGDFVRLLLLTALLSTAVAYVSYRWMERPLLNWVSRRDRAPG